MPKLTKYIIGVAVAAVVVFLLWYFSDIVAYILISAVLAIVGKPLVAAVERIRFKKFRIPRWLAALIAVAAIWTVAILFFMFFIPLVSGKIGELSRLDIPALLESFRTPLTGLQDFIVRFFAVSDPAFSIADELSGYLTGTFSMDKVNALLSSIVSIIGNTGIAIFSITFITFFFLKEENLFQNMIISLFPNKYEENIKHAIGSITNLLIRYFTGIIAESFIIMVLLSSAFMLWGITADTAFFMGLIMGILNVIPYIGPLMGGCLCVVVGILSPILGYDMVDMVLVIAGTIVCVKGLDDFVLQPTLYSNRVKAHPLEIFLVILIAGNVAGVLGMLLAIPSYTVLRVIAKEFFNNYRVVQKLTENI